MDVVSMLIGLVAGVALGMLVVGLVSIGSYDRGYRDASRVVPGSI